MSLSLDTFLYPILVAGYGRSGTTAIMDLLATDPSVSMEREYPFEVRYLSYFGKLASILDGRMPDNRFTDENLYPFEDSLFGPCPWSGHSAGKGINWIKIFWDSFSRHLRATSPEIIFYAEKAPVWLPVLLRTAMPCWTIYLFRDPRDVYLSSNAFMKKNNYFGFHRSPADTDLDHARSLAVELLNYFENFQQDKHRPDCFCLRYEDFVSDAGDLLAWLHTKGIRPDFDRAFKYYEHHCTSQNLTLSLERWRREAVSHRVIEFFERNLGTEMKSMGYFVELLSTERCVDLRPQMLAQHAHHAHGQAQLKEHELMIHFVGNDFGMLLPISSFCAEDVDEVWVSAAGCVGDHFSLYWRPADCRFSEERVIHVNYMPSQHWRVVRFRMSQHPLWRGTVHEIRLDLFNSRNNDNQGVGHLRWVRLVR